VFVPGALFDALGKVTVAVLFGAPGALPLPIGSGAGPECAGALGLIPDAGDPLGPTEIVAPKLGAAPRIFDSPALKTE